MQQALKQIVEDSRNNSIISDFSIPLVVATAVALSSEPQSAVAFESTVEASKPPDQVVQNSAQTDSGTKD